MRKIFLGSIIAFSLSFLLISIVKNAIITTKEPILKTVPRASINKSVAKVINIKEKVIKKEAVTKKTDYLNSWKLSATIIGTTSYAMVIKGRDSKVLRLKDGLESYTVKKILKNKVLFVNGSESVWLYIKSAFKKINNSIAKVAMPKVGTIVIRKASFKSNILNPEKLLKTVNIVPEIQSGIFKGLRIQHLLEGSFLYRHGLRQKDIINKINGKKLLSIADSITAYQNVTKNVKFSLSVLRDNKVEELKYEIVK